MEKPKTEIKRLKIASLTFDPQIYPRVDVSTQHVAEIAEALRAGATTPPIIVDGKDLRIVDGIHRWRAHKTVYGAQSEIEAEVRTYASERELFLDAVRLNADHGLPYSGVERTRNVLRAQELGIAEKEIAAALHIRIEKVEKMRFGKTALTKLGPPVALKRGMNWVQPGSTLTDEQERANKSAGGMPPLYYVNQLIDMLDAGLWESAGEQLRAALERLAVALARVREKKSA